MTETRFNHLQTALRWGSTRVIVFADTVEPRAVIPTRQRVAICASSFASAEIIGGPLADLRHFARIVPTDVAVCIDDTDLPADHLACALGLFESHDRVVAIVRPDARETLKTTGLWERRSLVVDLSSEPAP